METEACRKDVPENNETYATNNFFLQMNQAETFFIHIMHAIFYLQESANLVRNFDLIQQEGRTLRNSNWSEKGKEKVNQNVQIGSCQFINRCRK